MLSKENIRKLLEERILVLDGAMGTQVQALGLSEDDFRGERFHEHPSRLAGCNDILCLTQPGKIKGIHKAYLAAGADIISTDTFNANAVSLSDYGLGNDRDLIREINREGARIAVEAAREGEPGSRGGRALVAGSMGPTNRTASMSPDVSDPSARNITYDELFEAYCDQAYGLIEGGVDLLLFETVFDTLNLKAGLDAASKVMAEMGREVPVMVSATVSDRAGRTLSGQTVEAFAATVQDYDHVLSLGLNCSFGPAEIGSFLRELAGNTYRYISCHPNAGLPNALGDYDETPEDFAIHMEALADKGLVNIAGGCCGTTPGHIAAMAEAIAGKKPRKCPELPEALRVTGLEMLEIKPEINFVNVGERCNVAGSRKFLRLIKEGNYSEALSVASAQVAAGAMMIDINMDDALLDGPVEMVRFLRYIASDPDISRVPVMVDSSDWETVENALKNIQGKAIVNSISLKEGEEKFKAKALRIRELGAAVIVMAFDEEGQADTYERKIEVAQRAYRILTEECGYNPDDIIFDVNIMAVATGIEAHNRYGIDYIEAVRWVKENLPGARTSGGVSNLSFAFRGKNTLREAMHAVFLYHAIRSGLDMGIVNPSSSVTYEDIEPGLRGLIEDVVLARRPEAVEELAAYAMTEDAVGKKTDANESRDLDVPVGVRLSNALVKGDGKYLREDLEEVLSSGMSPVDIISGPLMAGMNRVGTLFGEGKMFLPQVVKTARTMKQAVDMLKPYMEAGKSEKAKPAGKALLATVKGDVHDIGKNIAGIVLACNNYEVEDLGVMVSAEAIVEAALRAKPDFIGLSGLITPSLAEMTNTVKALKEAGIDVPVMVGGATTSALHTALKIAPEYDGVVVHVKDASQNPVIASSLLSEKDGKEYAESVKEEQEKLREEYFREKTPLKPLDEARNDAFTPSFAIEASKPEVGLGKPLVIDLNLDDIIPFINWKMFLLTWRVTGTEPEKVREAKQLQGDALALLEEIKAKGVFNGKATVRFENAYSKDDTIFMAGESFPMLRQQQYGVKSLSLSDFIRRDNEGTDYIGLFAVTAGEGLFEMAADAILEGDEYRSLLILSVADRIVEAASEWLHMEVRRRFWGYASGEALSPAEILKGGYKGIRPAVGYPSMPDQLLNHTLGRLLPLEKIGVRMTENGAMSPGATVSGLYIAHPESSYFMVGKIGEDQVGDYASRRGIEAAKVKEILRIV